MGCRWRRNQPIADDDFIKAWTPYIWKHARLWCRRGGLPEHHVEEYVSAGFTALACVPPANRWSSRYVITAIRNRMLSASRRRQGQPHPDAMLNVDSLRGLCGATGEDDVIGALDIRQAVDALPEAQRDAVWMQIAGSTNEEIARELRLENVREILESAHALLRAALGRRVNVN